MEDTMHMTPDEFRRCGHALVDRIARYMEEIEHYPVLSQAEPGSIRRRLPQDAPERGEPFADVLRDIDEIVMPGITHWQSPNFFAFFPANASGPAILGDLLSSGLGVQGMLWATSPACTELETHVLDWLVDLLGLPDRFRSSTRGRRCRSGHGVEQHSHGADRRAGTRERRSGQRAWLRARCRASSDLHTRRDTHIRQSRRRSGSPASGAKACASSMPTIVTRCASTRWKRAIAADRAAGARCRRCGVRPPVGTTSSGAVDPVRAIGEVCRRERHLAARDDAAHAGSATICPEHRGLNDGVEHADSYTFNPHKWLLTNFDCNCFWVADRASLINALSVLPEYLRNQASETGEVIDYRDWHIPLGRRFRALKLWFVIRHYGAEGLRAHVRSSVSLADWFAAQVRDSEEFELAAPVSVGLVCFRHRGGDAVNQALMDRLNRSGALYLTHTKLDDRMVLRLAVGSPATRREHVEAAWARVVETARQFPTETRKRDRTGGT